MDSKKKKLCGTNFVISTKNGAINVFDTFSGKLKHIYEPPKHLKSKITCISVYQKESESEPQEVLAIGNAAGAVQIYNIKQERLETTLQKEKSHREVVDLKWANKSKLYSLYSDGLVVCWNVEKQKIIKSIKLHSPSRCLCLIGKKFIVGRTSVAECSFESGIEQQFTGHSKDVSQLFSLHTTNTSIQKYFLSSAVDDKFIYAWSCDNPNNGDPMCSFMALDKVRMYDCNCVGDNSLQMAITTKKGVVLLFNHHINGTKHSKPIGSSGELQIKDGDGNRVNIIAAFFTSHSSLLVAYGALVTLTFETFSVSKLLKKKETCVVRTEKPPSKDVSAFGHSSVGAQKAAHIVDATLAIENTSTSSRKRPAEDSTSLPMEEKLSSLRIEPNTRPNIDTATHLLVQGLHSNDTSLIENALRRPLSEQCINETVGKLPLKCVLPFLLAVEKIIITHGLQHIHSLHWVKSALVQHMSHLASVPQSHHLLRHLHSIGGQSVATLGEMLHLQARLNLMLTHIASKHDSGTQKQKVPALTSFIDESSDDDDTGVNEGETGRAVGDHILASESDDNFEDWAEEEEQEEEKGSGARDRKRRVNGNMYEDEDESDSDMEVQVVS